MHTIYSPLFATPESDLPGIKASTKRCKFLNCESAFAFSSTTSSSTANVKDIKVKCCQCMSFQNYANRRSIMAHKNSKIWKKNFASLLLPLTILLVSCTSSLASSSYHSDNDAKTRSPLFLTQASNDFNLAEKSSKQRRCEPITIPLCQRIGYNMTSYPNGYGHERQEEAGLEVHQFYPLVEVNCYKHLKFFLCSLYTPICQPDYELSLMPCQEVCLEARKKCSPIMQQYGFRWPATLDCSRLPKMSEQDSTGVICAAPPDAMDQATAATIDGDNDDVISDNKVQSSNGISHSNKANVPAAPLPPMVGIDVVDAQCECNCVRPYFVTTSHTHNHKQRQHSTHKHHRRVQNVSNCAYACHSDAIYSTHDRAFLNTWISIWSGFCFALSLFTVLTFLTDLNRFPYPERPIFFLSICQLMVSLGFMLRVFYGHENIACDGALLKSWSGSSSLFSLFSSTAGNEAKFTENFNVTANSEYVCLTVFVLIYYFGMAASAWWVVLSLSWVLAAVPHWSTEWIAKYSTYFHLFAWLVPGFQTTLVFFFNAIDGDPISGICYVGNTDVANLRHFVLMPLTVYFIVGVCFLLIGFLNLWGIRSNLKKTHPGVDKTSKLTQLMSKIGIFSVLYTVPAIFVILVLFYEQHYRNLWEQSQLCPCAQQLDNYETTVLLFTLIKTASMLVVGWTSGVWILSAKTLQSWRRVFTCGISEFCCDRETRRRRRQGYLPAVNRLSGSGCGAVSASHHPLHHPEDITPVHKQYQNSTIPYTAAAAVAEQTLNRQYQHSHFLLNGNNNNNNNNNGSNTASPFHVHHNHLHRSMFGGENCVSPITYATTSGTAPGTLRHCGGFPEKV